MAIVARILENTTAVAVAARPPLKTPEPTAVFALFAPEEQSGARFFDDPALGVRSFTLPALDLRLIFEPTRVRLEAMAPKPVDVLPLGTRLATVVAAVYPNVSFPRYGFNYDRTFQYDAVIPQRHIMEAFMDAEAVNAMTHFGWQCTLQKEKGKRKETYFFKVVSPLEIRILANIEFDRVLPEAGKCQTEFVQCADDAMHIVERLRFS